MIYEEGAVLEDAKWQAPVYCFQKGKEESLEHQHINYDAVHQIVDQKMSLGVLHGL